MARTPLFHAVRRALQCARRENLAVAGQQLPVAVPARNLSRRRFTQGALAGGAALAAGIPLGAAGAARSQDDPLGAATPRIAIVGAGLAGLNAAYQLRKRGLTATVYEARGRVGGRVKSVSGAIGDGLVTDLGAAFINSDHADLLALIEEFDLPLFDRAADAARFSHPTTAYVFAGRARSEQEVATALRPLAAQIAADAALLDADWDAYAPGFDARSVAAYLDEHAALMPEPWVRTLLENSIRTEYGVEPIDSSALQVLSLLPTVDGEAVEVLGSSDEHYVVEGGSARIAAALEAALPGQIMLRRRMTRIEAVDGGYRLTFDRNDDGEIVEADHVILAVPFPVLRGIRLEVSLPPELRRFIAEANLGRNERLLAGFDRRVWRQDAGFTLEAWTDLGFSSVWDETQRQPDREDGALSFYFGGDEVTTIAAGDPVAHAHRLAAQLDCFLPGLTEAASGVVFRTSWHASPYTQGAYSSFAPGQYTAFGGFLWIDADDPAERQEVVAGNLVFAGEHLSDAHYGYMNGAAETGRLAADTVARMVAAARPRDDLDLLIAEVRRLGQAVLAG